jgi:hypothetical protein
MMNNRELLGSRRADLLREANYERLARQTESKQSKQRKMLGLIQYLQRIRIL